MSRGRHRVAVRRVRARRAVVATAAAVVVAVVTTGLTVVAVEAFMTAGAGAGRAAGGSLVAVTLSPATGGADLRPGSRGTLRVVVSNPTPESVVVDRLVLDRSRGTDGITVDRPGCAPSLLSYTTQSGPGDGWRIDAARAGRDGTLELTLPGAVGLAASAPDACQGAGVTVHLTTGA